MNQSTQEILLITQEECAEVTQAISKVFRFGIDGQKPGNNKTNKEHLEEELGDLLAMINILTDKNIVSTQSLETAKNNKYSKLKQWSNIFK